MSARSMFGVVAATIAGGTCFLLAAYGGEWIDLENCEPAFKLNPVFGYGQCTPNAGQQTCTASNCSETAFEIWVPGGCFPDETKRCLSMPGVEKYIYLREQFCHWFSAGYCECTQRQAFPEEKKYVRTDDCYDSNM